MRIKKIGIIVSLDDSDDVYEVRTNKEQDDAIISLLNLLNARGIKVFNEKLTTIKLR